jgi:hypothetical protein|tara:strand:+ start:1119 stop:1424 length:306 start_codon:yes stop_codon:yes gene_type:complete
MYTCYVSTVGNPDRNQYAPISDPEWIEADTLQDLRTEIQEYQDDWNVRGGNWKNPIVYEVHGKTKKKIGSLSYNLRLWIKVGAVVGDKYIDGIEYEEGETK